ncbi:MAG TPA: hypothetical protein VGQ87_03670 [Patescibacteria group bacterium]|jgi:hypothetical protein|nr:hypothetical protein [Patescibacteria group bacterium]
MANIIKLGKTEDIVSVIQRIKNLQENEVIFELEKGALLLGSSANLKLMKRTGETMGKKITVKTDDEVGRLLAIKAGVLAGQSADDMRKIAPKSAGAVNSASVSDIKPKAKATVESASVQPLQPVAKASPAVLPKKFRLNFKFGTAAKIAGVVVAVLLLAIIASAIILPKANITIYARSEPINRDFEIKVDKNITAPDIENSVIPGMVVTKEVSQTKNFIVTGKAVSGTKASGTAQLYNFTKNTLTLKASTTTLIDASGKKYFFTKDATGLRPTGGTQSQPDQKTLTAPISIIAEEPGDTYNIPAGTKLEIKNAALGNKPEVYAITASDIAGGASTSQTALTQQDLDNAVTKMAEDLTAAAQTELAKDEGAGSSKLLVSGIKQEILAKTANRNVGDQVENFDMTVIARLTGLSFKEDDVRNIVNQKMQAFVSEDKYLVAGAKENLTEEYKSFDLDLGTGMLAVHYETLAAFKIDTTGLAKLLAGKKASEIKEILLSKPEIDSVDIKLSPFFAKSAPRVNGKIFINTLLSNTAAQ